MFPVPSTCMSVTAAPWVPARWRGRSGHGRRSRTRGGTAGLHTPASLIWRWPLQTSLIRRGRPTAGRSASAAWQRLSGTGRCASRSVTLCVYFSDSSIMRVSTILSSEHCAWHWQVWQLPGCGFCFLLFLQFVIVRSSKSTCSTQALRALLQRLRYPTLQHEALFLMLSSAPAGECTACPPRLPPKRVRGSQKQAPPEACLPLPAALPMVPHSSTCGFLYG